MIDLGLLGGGTATVTEAVATEGVGERFCWTSSSTVMGIFIGPFSGEFVPMLMAFGSTEELRLERDDGGGCEDDF